MAISDRITSIEEHIKESYQELEGIGIDTTGVNNNLENIPKLIDGYWETLPKVTGEGTSITLDNTKEGKMKINLKGNTSQETTTGKNLFNIEGRYETGTGITYTKNNDGSYTLNGTANGNNFLRGLCYLNEQHTISYTSNTTNANVIIRTRTGTPSAQTGIKDQMTVSSTSGSLTSSKQFDFVEISIVNGTTLNNFKIYIQLEKGSSVTTFEKYTGGIASPNPDYPQDIHVVSGNNSINVCGKNLFDKDSQDILENVRIGADGGNNADSGYFISEFIEVTPNTKYTKNTTADAYHRFAFYTDKSTNSFISKSENNTITTPSNAKYLRICGLITEKGSIQLEKGTQATTYEAYKGASYPISLGVENLLNTTMTSQTLNGVQFNVNEDKSIWIKGTATARTEPNLWTGSMVLKAGTTYYNNTDTILYLYANAYYSIGANSSYTPTNDLTLTRIYIRVENGEAINKTIYPMLSTKQTTNYCEYGKNIELCKIGDYQDSIKKSTGKNLFDKNAITESKIINRDNGVADDGVNYDISDYIEVEVGENYTFSNFNKWYSAYYDSNKNYVGYPTNTDTITIPSGVKYIRLSCLKTNIDIVQFEKGNTATPYEPYGTSWYLNKQIGKVVLNGSEGTWGMYNVTQGNLFRNMDILRNVVLGKLCYANYYRGIEVTASNFSTIRQDGDIYINPSNPYIDIVDNTQSSASNFVSWLGTHNLILYYAMTTPTYTEITDSTLLSQLNALAKSYNSQTNISQESNDLASLLNATALREM